MPFKKTADPGKWAEAEVERVMHGWSEKTTRVAYHRYPDARAARGTLAAQPADFLLAAYGRTFHIEVKESVNPHRLPRTKVPQWGKLKMFWWAGILPRVVVYRSVHKDWYVLTERELFPMGDITPTSFPYEAMSHQAFKSVEDAMRWSVKCD